MSKKKKVLIISLIVLLIFVSLISFFVISFNNDRKKTLKKMDNIIILYDKFSSKVDSFNTIREDIYGNVLSNVYYDTLKANYDLWNTKLLDYEKFVDQIDSQFSKLRKSCDGVYYPDSNINNKCQAFIVAYEEIKNSFVSDISLFNKNIDEYNSYSKEQGASDTLEKYNTKKKYVDYNHDKKYSGKDEENENE